MRELILLQYPLCAYCRADGLITGADVLDHRVSLALAGTNDEANLIPACEACNSKKGTAERKFIARGYDSRDIMFDPDLAYWLSKADAGMVILRQSLT